MENKNIQRLLHTLAAFILLTAVQKLLNFLCGIFIPDRVLTSLLAFLTASAFGIYFFRFRPTADEDNGDGDASDSGVEELSPGHPLLCVLGTVTALALMVGAMSLLGAWFDGESAVKVSVLSVLSLVILHPILEETIYRRLFYGELRLLNPIFACLAQAVMFAISHDTTESMLYALIAGVVLGALTEVCGTYLCGVVVHFCINLRSFLYLALLHDKTELIITVDMIVIVLGVISLIAALILNTMGVFRRRERDGSSGGAV